MSDINSLSEQRNLQAERLETQLADIRKKLDETIAQRDKLNEAYKKLNIENIELKIAVKDLRIKVNE